MRYVVAYDISEDPVRSRVVKALGGFGVRVQESVFECVLSRNGDLDLLIKRLEEAVATDESPVCSIRIYRLCADCLQASYRIGTDSTGVLDTPCLVV